MARQMLHQTPFKNVIVKSKHAVASPQNELWGCLQHMSQIVQRAIARVATRKSNLTSTLPSSQAHA